MRRVSAQGGIESARRVDALLALLKDEYRRQFASQLGDIGTISAMILMAVFFTNILLTGNTAAQAFAERMPELAVMKTLGFGDDAGTRRRGGALRAWGSCWIGHCTPLRTCPQYESGRDAWQF